jgi:hypothetical protein
VCVCVSCVDAAKINSLLRVSGPALLVWCFKRASTPEIIGCVDFQTKVLWYGDIVEYPIFLEHPPLLCTTFAPLTPTSVPLTRTLSIYVFLFACAVGFLSARWRLARVCQWIQSRRVRGCRTIWLQRHTEFTTTFLIIDFILFYFSL